jgi:hypothetical protein
MILIACKAQNKQKMDNQNLVLQYSDGSGNSWKIMPDSISYSPVSPGISSSGFYNGGEGFTVAINKSEFYEILQRFEKIFDNPDIHIPHRVMTSGLLIISGEGMESRKIIIGQGSEMESLELLLNKICRK